LIKTHPAKLPRITENKRPLRLLQDKVIVFASAKIWRLNAEPATHPKMNSQPAPNVFAPPDFFRFIARENEKHLFPARLGPAQFLVREITLESDYIGSSKDSLLAVQPHRADGIADSDVPLFPKILHLGQLWHVGRLERSRPPCYPWRAWKKLSSSEVVARV